MEMFKISKLCFSKKKKKKTFQKRFLKCYQKNVAFIRSIFNREVMGAIVTNR
jgi:hypothetical protein